MRTPSALALALLALLCAVHVNASRELLQERADAPAAGLGSAGVAPELAPAASQAPTAAGSAMPPSGSVAGTSAEAPGSAPASSSLPAPIQAPAAAEAAAAPAQAPVEMPAVRTYSLSAPVLSFQHQDLSNLSLRCSALQHNVCHAVLQLIADMPSGACLHGSKHSCSWDLFAGRCYSCSSSWTIQ